MRTNVLLPAELKLIKGCLHVDLKVSIDELLAIEQSAPSKRGRPMKLTDHEEQLVLGLLESGISADILADSFSCSRMTIYRIRDRHNLDS